jgi:hypothetical protein
MTYRLMRVWFTGGTKTHLWVAEDDTAIEVIATMCDHEGISPLDVLTYEITEKTYTEEEIP